MALVWGSMQHIRFAYKETRKVKWSPRQIIWIFASKYSKDRAENIITTFTSSLKVWSPKNVGNKCETNKKRQSNVKLLKYAFWFWNHRTRSLEYTKMLRTSHSMATELTYGADSWAEWFFKSLMLQIRTFLLKVRVLAMDVPTSFNRLLPVLARWKMSE